MGRAEFEENSLRGILDKSKTVDETIIESAENLSRLFADTEREFSAVYAELSRSRMAVQEKLASAQRARSEYAKRIENCRERYNHAGDGDEKDKAERTAYNAQVDSEIARLQQVCGELDGAVYALEQVFNALNRMEQRLSLAQNTFNEERARTSAEMQRSLSYGERFYRAVGNAYTKATEIINFREDSLPVKWHGVSYKINRSGHETKRNFQTSAYGLFKAEHEYAVFAQGNHYANDGPTESVVLETNSAEEFFARLAEIEETVSVIKIPSYNFHKIGGKQTLQELKRRGFEVNKADGSMIGNDGYITWEKKK